MKTTQLSKFNQERKIFLSLLMGLISIGIIPGMWMILPPLMELGSLVKFIGFLIAPLIAFIGLALGILAFKSTKRKLAMIAIILNLIGLLIPTRYFLF